MWCSVVGSLPRLGLSIQALLILSTLSSHESAFPAVPCKEKLLWFWTKVAFVYRYKCKYLEDSLTLSNYLNNSRKDPTRACYFHGCWFLSRSRVPRMGSLLWWRPSIKAEWLDNSMTLVPLLHSWACLPLQIGVVGLRAELDFRLPYSHFWF